jgi:hypothetical protein
MFRKNHAHVKCLSKRAREVLTHVKISHLVTSLPTSRQQDVFALLVTSCQQVWNNLLTTCNNLVEIIRPVARLFWQVRYMLDITRLLQPCVDNLVTSLLYHGCNKHVSTCSLVTTLIMPSSLLQVVNSLFQTCYNKLGTSSASTTCWQLVNRRVTTCLQTCYNLCVFTCVDVFATGL